MTHQVFIGIAKNIVAIGPVLTEVQVFAFKNGDQVGELFHHLFAATEFVRIVKVRHPGELVGITQGNDDFLIDVVAYGGLAFQGNHIRKGGTFRDFNRRAELADKFIADVFHKEHHQHIVFVLAGIHPAPQLVAAGPER